MPEGRWRLLQAGTVLLLSAYYLNYGTSFTDGESDASNPLTLLMRLAALTTLVGALCPIRLRFDATWAMVALYAMTSASFLLSWGLSGALNDSLYFNTIIQLPILIALAGSRWRVDYARWLRLIAVVLLLQACIDVGVLVFGTSLWISKAFVGGVGNPSSFGLYCSLLFAFCLLHPDAGRWGLAVGIGLALSAIMTKSLLALMAVFMVYVIWALRSWRRAVLGILTLGVTVVAISFTLFGTTEGDEIGFVEHKLSAAAALFGVIDYDVDSSASIAGRLEMHEVTYAAFVDEPSRLLLGHLRSKPYWPIDSQMLTYLGSFGALMLTAFVVLHVHWTLRGWHQRRHDSGFAFVALCLFALIFLTNRILDYFPVATLYFVCIAMTLGSRRAQAVLAFQPEATSPRK
jgi:hypothetical protein